MTAHIHVDIESVRRLKEGYDRYQADLVRFNEKMVHDPYIPLERFVNTASGMITDFINVKNPQADMMEQWDSLVRLHQDRVHDAKAVISKLQDVSGKLNNYIGKLVNLERSCPSGYFADSQLLDIDQSFISDLDKPTMYTRSGFILVNPVKGDRAKLTVDRSFTFTVKVGVKLPDGTGFGRGQTIKVGQQIIYMESGLVKVVLSLSGEEATYLGLVIKDKISKNAKLELTFLLDPSDLDKFENSLNPTSLLNQVAGRNSSPNPLDLLNSVKFSMAATNTTEAGIGDKLQIDSDTKTDLAETGAAVSASESLGGSLEVLRDGTQIASADVNFKGSADAVLNFCGDAGVNISGHAEANMGAHLKVTYDTHGIKDVGISIDGSVMAEGHVTVFGHDYMPTKPYNAIRLRYEMSTSLNELANAGTNQIENDLKSGDITRQIAAVEQLLKNGVKISFDVEYGHVETKKLGVDFMGTGISGSETHTQWESGGHFSVEHGRAKFEA